MPHLLDTLRLPCLATGTPAADTTKAETVEILKVKASSPPVPTISSTSPLWVSLVQCSRITMAQAVISSMLSPFIRMAVRKAAIWALVARPVMISSITLRAVSRDRSCPVISWAMASLIMAASPFLGQGEKVFQDFPTVRCQDGFRMELQPVDFMIPVLHRHNLAGIVLRRHQQLVG